MLRVGERLKNSSMPSENQHQVILPSWYHLTELIIRTKQQRFLHAGPQYLLVSLAWIPTGRQVIHTVLQKCLPYFKQKQLHLSSKLTSFRQQEYNRQGHFLIALQITQDHFTSKKDHPGARFKSNVKSPFSFA
jgi:hypothetical protein